MKTVTSSVLRELAEGGNLREITIIENEGGYSLLAKYGRVEKALSPMNHPKKPRIFKNLNSVAKFVKEDLNFPEMKVQLAN